MEEQGTLVLESLFCGGEDGCDCSRVSGNGRGLGPGRDGVILGGGFGTLKTVGMAPLTNPGRFVAVLLKQHLSKCFIAQVVFLLRCAGGLPSRFALPVFTT